MPPTRHQRRLEELFHEALARPTAERRAFVEQQCSGEPLLRAELLALLAQDEKGTDDILKPPTPSELEADAPPLRIGRYTILERVGEGGMGTVWLAQQDAPVRRKVALKIVKAGLHGSRVLARFETERQALALMDHPNIARVFDGGATEDGRPYLVMEVMNGPPIHEYCDRACLTIEQRLLLFCAVCDAVQHAHQKGVIHRDLKPANVLVTEQDGQPTPKIIDFGIARAIAQPLTDKPLHTRHDEVVGTYDYMSPEQAAPGWIDVDTRTDIYSLGVLLYELLTGALPFDSESLHGQPLAEVQRILRDKEPPRPSTRVARLREGTPDVARPRGAEGVRALSRRLRGDLDWITMKALEKERNRRYASASELAADVRRHLRDEPVLASPPSSAYRIGKFVRRNRATVAIAAVLSLSVLGGIAGTTHGLWSARRAREDALEEARRATNARVVADRERRRADAQAERLRRQLYASRMLLAENALRNGEHLRLHRLLADCPPDLRGFEWRYLHWISDRSDRLCTDAAGFRDVAFVTPTTVVAGNGAGELVAWDITAGERGRTVRAHAAPIVAVVAGGSWLATGAAFEVKLWELPDLTLRHTFTTPEAVLSLAFSPDGGRLAVLSERAFLQVFEVPSGRELLNLPALARDLFHIAWTADGEHLVAGGTGLTLFDAHSGARLAQTLDANVDALALAPNGGLAYSSGPDVHLRATPAAGAGFGAPFRTFTGHSGRVEHIDFGAGGERMATASHDGCVRLWDVATGESLLTLRGHRTAVRRVVLGPIGERLVSLAGDELRVWSADAAPAPCTVEHPGIRHGCLAVSPDGRTLACDDYDAFGIVLWDAEDLRPLRVLRRHDTPVTGIGYAGASRLASIDMNGTILLWDTARGAVERCLSTDVTAGLFAVSPDGWIAALRDGDVQVWDAASGAPCATTPAPLDEPTALRASADGDHWILTDAAGAVVEHDARSGVLRRSLRLTGGPFARVIELARQRGFAAVTADGRVHGFAADGTPRGSSSEPLGSVHALGASHDGTRIVVGLLNGQIWIFDTETLEPLISLRDLPAWPTELAFTPDDRTLVATHTRGRQLWLWETVPPAGGFGDRDVVRRAAAAVAAAETQAIGSEAVAARIAATPMAEAVRVEALERCRVLGDDPFGLNERAWDIVRFSNRSPAEYAAALERAEIACRLEPDYPPLLNTLGVARYRAGRYREAITALTESQRLSEGLGVAYDAFDIAFLAMAWHGLGDHERARAELERLRRLMALPEVAREGDLQVFWREAETLIAPR